MSRPAGRLQQIKAHVVRRPHCTIHSIDGPLTLSRHLKSNPSPGRSSVQAGPAQSESSAGTAVVQPRSSKDVPQAKATYYKYFLPFQTKWHENDMYDHLNNAVYVTYFDAIINQYLITQCKMRPSATDAPIGLVISSSFNYLSAVEFPHPLMTALAVTKLGKSSVRYAIALFAAERVSSSVDLAQNEFTSSLKLVSGTAAAYGEMTHVFVDPNTRRPVDIDPKMREELSKLVVE